jgi:hypothetical protein
MTAGDGRPRCPSPPLLLLRPQTLGAISQGSRGASLVCAPRENKRGDTRERGGSKHCPPITAEEIFRSDWSVGRALTQRERQPHATQGPLACAMEVRRPEAPPEVGVEAQAYRLGLI